MNALWPGHQRCAELMLLQVVQTMMQCLRFCWYDAFHKTEQNFIKNLIQDKCYSAKQVSMSRLSLDRLLWVQKVTNFLHW